MEIAATTEVDVDTRARIPRVTDTHWGYVIHEQLDRFEHETLGRAAARFGGLVLVLSAYGQWLLPAVLYGPESGLARSIVSLTLGVLGVLVYWCASRSVQIDLQVDLARRELRLTETKGRGNARLRAVFPMGQVASAFIARTKDGASQPQLFLEMRDRDEVMHVATGPESDLLVLHRRLSYDLRPIEERINRRLARELPFRTQRKLGPISSETVQQ
ncbi:MAG: hypothetical protein AAGK37_00360 [Pseudomonadota bacterium]